MSEVPPGPKSQKIGSVIVIRKTKKYGGFLIPGPPKYSKNNPAI